MVERWCSVDAGPSRVRTIATLAALALAAASCDEPRRPVLIRPTPVSSTDWGPGQHTLSGTVTEADDRPIEGALVSASHKTATTDSGGRFRFEQVGPTTIDVRKDGYEKFVVKTYDALATSDLVVDLVLARVVRIQAGETHRATLSPKDADHRLEAGHPTEPFCGPCKLVRIGIPSTGVVSVRVEWSSSEELELGLAAVIGWEYALQYTHVKVTSGSGSAIASIDAEGQEVVACVGLGMTWPNRGHLTSPVPFTMTTSFQATAGSGTAKK